MHFDNILTMYSYNLTENYKKQYDELKLLNAEHIQISDFIPSADHILIHGKHDIWFNRPIRINTPSVYIVFDSGSLDAYVSLDNNEKYYFLPNYREYVILKDTMQPIPKILTSGLPKDAYIKANAYNCCIKKEGSFLELPSQFISSELSSSDKIYMDEEKRLRYVSSDKIDEALILDMIKYTVNTYTRYL